MGGNEDVAAPFGNRNGVATSPSPREGAWRGNEDVAAPFGNRNGVATSPSPWEGAWEGNEDVAAPVDLGSCQDALPGGESVASGSGKRPGMWARVAENRRSV